MVPWSCTDTRAARGSCDPDIATDQAHFPVPSKLVKLGGGRCRWFDDDQGDRRGLCCCCCCWSVTLGFVGSPTVVSFAPTGSMYIAVKPGMGSPILSPAISKYRVVDF